ncbi:MAG TPA: acetyl-CoA carboxylase biotin carboxyl carrier protein [Pyrinomonadaceae bacterium]|nr:acetyl-CoA carboxylase biotin carboxyl carrier protein [Pyrinomonadaceae bacterium]
MEPAKKMNNPESQNAADQPQTTDEVSVEQDSTARAGGRRRRNQIRTEIPVNLDELRELIELIRENEFTEFELEREDFRVRFRRGAEAGESTGAAAGHPQTVSGSAPSTTTLPAAETGSTPSVAPSHPGAKAQTEASEDQDLYIIPSPIVGTFYRSPSPNTDSFVKIGSRVEPDTIVCIIEAMKLMNEIQSETSGEVAKIYVENGQPVEYGQPLFGIKK